MPLEFMVDLSKFIISLFFYMFFIDKKNFNSTKTMLVYKVNDKTKSD